MRVKNVVVGGGLLVLHVVYFLCIQSCQERGKMLHNKMTLLPCFKAKNFVLAVARYNQPCSSLLCFWWNVIVVFHHENMKRATSVRIRMLKMLSFEGGYLYCILRISSVHNLVKRGE